MSEREPGLKQERVIDQGTYQGKLADIVRVDEPGRILLEVRLRASNEQYGGMSVEIQGCLDEKSYQKALEKVKNGKNWKSAE